jgi:hypothetical protein
LSVLISLSDLATNWSDPNGLVVSLTGINLVTTSGLTLQTNGNWIFYTNNPSLADQISYGIADAFGGTNIGYINIVVAGSITDNTSITRIVTGANNVITAYGIPGYAYVLERATSLSPAVWADVATTTAATNGLINAADTFSDLGGVAPPNAYYRLKWQP